MALQEYDVTVDGRPTTLLLSDEDARAYGLNVPAPADEPMAAEEPATPAGDGPETKAHTPDNKARTAANKSGNAR